MSAPVKFGGHLFAIESRDTSSFNLNFRVSALRTLQIIEIQEIKHQIQRQVQGQNIRELTSPYKRLQNSHQHKGAYQIGLASKGQDQ